MVPHIHSLGPKLYQHSHRGGKSGRFGWPDHHHPVAEYQRMKLVYAPVWLGTPQPTSNPASSIQFVIGFPQPAHRASGAGGSRVQSVLFDKHQWRAGDARKWLGKQGFRYGDLDETEERLRFQQEPPEKFVRFRTIGAGDAMNQNPSADKGVPPPSRGQSSYTIGHSPTGYLYWFAKTRGGEWKLFSESPPPRLRVSEAHPFEIRRAGLASAYRRTVRAMEASDQAALPSYLRNYLRGEKPPRRNPRSSGGLPGLSRWNMYAGGTSAAEGKRAYDIRGDFGLYSIQPLTTPQGRHRGYLVQFADEKGRLGGGLWTNLGLVHSPSAGVGQAREHYAHHFGDPATRANPTYSEEMRQKYGVPYDPTRVASAHGFRVGDRVVVRVSEHTSIGAPDALPRNGQLGWVTSIPSFGKRSVSPDPARMYIAVDFSDTTGQEHDITSIPWQDLERAGQNRFGRRPARNPSACPGCGLAINPLPTEPGAYVCSGCGAPVAVGAGG